MVSSSANTREVLDVTGLAQYVEQIVDLQTYQPEKRFGDAVKGLHVYGAKVIRPTVLACLIADKA